MFVMLTMTTTVTLVLWIALTLQEELAFQVPFPQLRMPLIQRSKVCPLMMLLQVTQPLWH